MVASYGGLAASGGCWISCDADTIVSNPNSIVGSIGGFTGKFVFNGLLDKVGVNTEPMRFGDNSDIYSPLSSLTETQRARLEGNIEQLLDMFEGYVAEGRGMTREQVTAIGGGRIYAGRRGLEIGLVDEIGGLHEAIQMAMELAGVDGEAEVESYPRRPHFWEVVREADPAVRWNSLEGRWLYSGVTLPE